MKKLPKKEYFLQRLQDAIANQDQGKQIYYLSRYKLQVELETQALAKQITELEAKTAPKKRGPLKKKEYVFSFVGGGWNSVWAKTKAGAEKAMKAEYLKPSGMPVNMNLIPVEGSARTVTPAQYNALLNSFN